MRKRVKMLLAAALCVTTMTAVGCGNNSQQAVSGTTDASTAVEAVDPSIKFCGEWKLAYIETDGMTIAGDLSGMAELAGEDINITLNLGEDGAGSMVFGSDTFDLTWELVDDNNASITMSGGKDDAETPVGSIPAAYEGGELRLDMSNASDDTGDGDELAESVSEGTMVLTADGKSDRAKNVDIAEATEITSADALVGEWKLSGVGMFGLYMYGNADSVDKMFGEESAVVTFKDDGTCSFIGSDAAYEVTADGAVLVDDSMGTSVPIKAYGDDIIVDMSAFFGAVFGSDLPLFMVYSK